MRIGSIVIRCYEFEKLLHFWKAALHYTEREPATDTWVVLADPTGKGPNISLKRVYEKHTGKRSKLHLDVYTDSQEEEVKRLVGLGAMRYPWRHVPGDDFIVLADPDDNLFCVIDKSGSGCC